MRLSGKRKRKGDAVKGARVLIYDADATELDRLSALIRAAGCKVMALGRLDALLSMGRVFRPEVAVIGLSGPELEEAKVGRRLSRKFKGAVPVLYVGDADEEGRRFCLDSGCGMDLLPRERAQHELMLRLRRLLSLKAAVQTTVRAEYDQRSPTMHDEVTGLYNRNFLLEMVGTESRRGERYGGSFTVLIAELDDFMAIRDRFGDEVCDRLMVYCSVLLRQALREADVIARVGRFHFGTLLPGMPQEAVPGALERLRRRFSLARMQVDGESLRPKMTFGCASFPDVVGPAQQIFSSAIQDLDRAREVAGTGPRQAV